MQRFGDVAGGVGDRLADRRLIAGARQLVPVAEARLDRARKVSIVATASTGYSPMAVSSDSMSAEVPSRTALATSLASARVGSGAWSIDSSICVAVITGLPVRAP